MLVIDGPVTVNVPTPPLSPIVVPAVLGNRVTVPVPASSLPDVLKFTEPAFTTMGELVEDALNPLLMIKAPEPCVVKLIPLVPEISELTVMDPLLAVVVSCSTPLVAIVFAVEILLSADTVKLLNVEPPELKLSVPVLVTVALPVVFRVNEGVAVLRLPIVPLVELSEIDVEPVSVPAV